MPTPSVTVIIPTFNRAVFLRESLESVLAQTVAPDHVLVVDDGSTDMTREVVRGYAGSVAYLVKPNGGKSSALNLALPLVRTDAVWVFDDDDIALPGALAALSGGLAANPACGFAYGSYRMFTDGADGTRAVTDPDFPSVRPERLFVALMGLSFIHQPGLLVRRSCYEAVGPFDEALPRSQDYDMLLRLARRFPGREVPGPLFLQRRHTGVRGTAAFRVRAADVEAAWKRFDQIILRRMRQDCALADFLPRAAAPRETLTDAERFAALLERAVIVGRRGLWDLAGQDLAAAVGIANEAGIDRLTPEQPAKLHRLFDVFSDGAADFAQAGGFLAALRLIAHPALEREMRTGLSRGLPYRIKLAARAGRTREAARLLRIYARIAHPGGVARALARKLPGARARRTPPPDPRAWDVNAPAR